MSDEAKKGFMLFAILMILTLFCSTVRAEEKVCAPGSIADNGKKSQWTVLIPGHKLRLYGTICGVGDEWEGRDVKNNKVYFHGTYILIGGGNSEHTKTISNDRIRW